jgi:hypothetical protein
MAFLLAQLSCSTSCLECFLEHQFAQGIPSPKCQSRWRRHASNHAAAPPIFIGDRYDNCFYPCRTVTFALSCVGTVLCRQTLGLYVDHVFYSFIFHILSCIDPPAANSCGSPKLALSGETLTHPFSMAQLSQPSGKVDG